MHLRIFQSFLVSVCSLLISLSAFAESHFDDIPPAPEIIPLRKTLGLRMGFIASGLFSSKQGRPFFYFDTGFRYKTDHAYFDLRLPILTAGVDGLFYLLQSDVLKVREPFNFFELMNKPIHYGADLEIGMLKLGQTWALDPEQFGGVFRISTGIFFLPEFVFFDLALFDDRDLEEFDPQNDPNAADPMVISAGGFFALGGDFPNGSYDIALGTGPDFFQDNDYSANPGWVIFVDADVQFDVSEDIGISLRSKIATYTHTEKMVFTLVVNGGIIVRLY